MSPFWTASLPKSASDKYERMKKMKKFISILLVLVLCIGTTAFADTTVQDAMAEPPIKLIADNKIIDTPTHMVNNRTLVPVRALMESIGATVEWVDATQTVIITRNNKTITVQIGNGTMTTPDGAVALDAAPMLLNNATTTYVPLRAICEAFGLTVDWDESGSNTILVLSPDGCPYVDTYDGATLAEYLVEIGATPEDFSAATGIDYEANKDRLYVMVDNEVSIENIALMNGYTTEEFLATIGTPDVDPATPWGEYTGNLTMSQYITTFTPALQYGMTEEDALNAIKTTYGFGDEYTLNTKFKYMRTAMAISDYQYQKEMEAQQAAQQKAEEEMIKAATEALPELLKKKVAFTITLSDNRKMKGELYPDLAPVTVENFIKLCNENFYEGLIFHRVIDGFMIQGGGFDKDFNQKEAASIVGEFFSNGFANALTHEKGVLSMARTNDPNSASSQFFIIDESSPHLDGQYAAFGKITEGLDVVDAISKVETHTNDKGHSDVPVKPIVIKSIKIDK